MHEKLFAVFATALSLALVSGSFARAQPSGSVQQKTQEIVFGPVRTYDHKSGWFSLTIPGNWKVTDKSGEGEVIVSIIDPTENGVIVVRVYQPSRGYTQAELGDLLKGFLNERMGSFDGFSMGEAKSQRDGSLGLYFKYNSVVEGVTYKMNGDAFIEQHNGLIGVLTLIMPQEQYETKQKAAYEIMNSFRVTGTAP
jgi:serine/threonine-protein kinase